MLLEGEVNSVAMVTRETFLQEEQLTWLSLIGVRRIPW